jgi:hypothetical protein
MIQDVPCTALHALQLVLSCSAALQHNATTPSWLRLWQYHQSSREACALMLYLHLVSGRQQAMAPQHSHHDAARHPQQPDYCQRRQRLQRQRAWGSKQSPRVQSGSVSAPDGLES